MTKWISIGRAAQLLRKSDTYVRALLAEQVLIPVGYVDNGRNEITVLDEDSVLRLAAVLANEEALKRAAVA